MSYRIQITNYPAIRSIDFSPNGVCLIVGPNGVGKTVLLSAIEFMRNALERGFGTALTFSGGAWGFTNFNVPQDTQTISRHFWITHKMYKQENIAQYVKYMSTLHESLSLIIDREEKSLFFPISS
ncbi:hypothetical protein U27_03723 [Candidatus Vecturithrix granuli]|uniref:Endonuclease GajA/Old nuclease/RecF-like AAA domain-containing protein n=1 Tax=Vecturithrix granuli TaxID=1499967 RepID=A0A081BWQ4_VECG1|nr:hypothetical protein U27_03723 [Candidatus Vecturithrix granuli]